KELAQRMLVNAKEVEVIISDFKSGMQLKRNKYIRDPYLVYNLSIRDQNSLIALSKQLLLQEFSSEMVFFNREGKEISRVYKDEKNILKSDLPKGEAIFLSDKFIAFLKGNRDIGSLDFKKNRVNLGLITKVINQKKKTVGYLQQIVYLDYDFLYKLKNRLRLEFFLTKEDGAVLVSTFSNQVNISTDTILKAAYGNKSSLFEAQVKKTPYGFYVTKIDWGHTKFLLGMGASKADSRKVLKNINFAYFTVVGIVTLCLFITILITSSWILKPLYELVAALQSFENQEQAVTIPVKNNTEIGLLTESFNQMSTKIWQARSDLNKKVKELEEANKMLIETQKKLVHSAKMISLGELVAGVAHELNNPISFIYSNMTHLSDYSNKLIELIKISESNPAQLNEKKEEFEFDFIQKDLPKLIHSCEEGARRTRDIVLGLRNFSRLDEAQVKKVDLRELMDTSLNLVQGEIKNKIEIDKHYEEIPLIKCYASQISQVFVNLLSNAIQAMESNGKIWITMKPTDKDNTSSIVISIQDTGKGIKAEYLDQIFDPFFTTKPVGKGTGLGLSITYGIIQKHGGDIQVKSSENVGTEFIITIPTSNDLIDKS
ncbi:MAG: HAMP domain-containing histidine kinase, partial [Bdellovibrionales bacterium]|nr:HAMP domain-containing histidine kinase [Bdellovibrionales bacterium]